METMTERVIWSGRMTAAQAREERRKHEIMGFVTGHVATSDGLVLVYVWRGV